ncbi:ABC transporter substrate-binding protein [Streptomyces libani]|uniref:ABC transporter substrate-binding protein n=2 Tax=Streptomyces nigrescens TaxID=1920 RepID=A0ABY7ID99_STRNI|nr:MULTISPECIES: ABC transporter substrate-binding protein [Streptomyces]AWN29473.1 ABC transporter substrate-binding protein [Streptomyces sp. NEAU-S7GS2]MCX5445248.1 ABC transporter substrate-binding protein [Streptomyces libani]MYT16214.1 transporter substrate-binding domain-containing protein [Streptomyces sp. SID4951]MYX09875.1 transporter substrate-binding domain-containing protein [Streptomyces sp. SID8375]QIK06615.1 ABC transporter substrate-binding protein [Streptomyces sp. ID38640]
MTASTTRRSAAGRSRTAVAAATAVAASLLLLSACGDQTNEAIAKREAKKSRNVNAPLFKLLPKDVQEKGFLQVGSDITYKPVEFRSNGKIEGIDPDLAAAMSKELGIKLNFNNATFDTLMGGLKSKRYDIAMSAMTDTKERQEGIDSNTGKKIGKGVDFIDYLNVGVSLYTRKGKTNGVDGWETLCGKKIAVQRGTVSHDLAKDKSKACESNDSEPISIEAFDNDSEAQTRLRTGGVDAVSSDYPVAAYAVKVSGKGKDFQMVGGAPLKAAPYGIAVPKGQDRLRDALKAAVERTIKNGSYAKVLDKWDVKDAAVKKVQLNGG